MLCIFVGMKNVIIKYIILLGLICFFVACTNRQEELSPQISITMEDGEDIGGSSLSFEGEGGEALIRINSNSDWCIGCNAKWVSFSTTEGSGDDEVMISVDTTDVSRSAVVVVYAELAHQIRESINVIQHRSSASNSDDQPSDDPDSTTDENPEEQPDESPNEQPQDTPSDQPEDESDNQPNDVPSNQPADDSEQQPDDDSTLTPDDTPTDDSDDEIEDEPEEPAIDKRKVADIRILRAGVYYIGGYQNDVLHLAVGGILSGHLYTAPFTYDEVAETLSASHDLQAVEVSLEAAGDANTYYLNFDSEGYLEATAETAGALAFTDTPQAAWQFKQVDGGFELWQVGSNVKIIISPRATDRLLRSINGDDEGNPILLFRND